MQKSTDTKDQKLTCRWQKKDSLSSSFQLSLTLSNSVRAFLLPLTFSIHLSGYLYLIHPELRFISWWKAICYVSFIRTISRIDADKMSLECEPRVLAWVKLGSPFVEFRCFRFSLRSSWVFTTLSGICFHGLSLSMVPTVLQANPPPRRIKS